MKDDDFMSPSHLAKVFMDKRFNYDKYDMITSKARSMKYLVKLSERCPRVCSLPVLLCHLCLALCRPQLLSSFAPLPTNCPPIFSFVCSVQLFLQITFKPLEKVVDKICKMDEWLVRPANCRLISYSAVVV